MSDDSKVVEAMQETKRARNQSAGDNLRQSLAGWRSMAGMTLGLAVFVDLMFIIGGAYAVQTYGAGAMGIGGGVLVAIGLFGLLEKTARRVW